MIHIYGKLGETARLLAKRLNCRISRTNLPVKNCLIINWGWSCGRGLNSQIIGDKQREFWILNKAGLTPEGWNNIPSADKFPVLGRKRHHTQGKDIIFYSTLEEYNKKNKNDFSNFYVKYINKIKEYRAHVLGGKVELIAEKIRKDDNSDPIIWNCNKRYAQYTYSKDRLYWNKIAELAIKAVKAVNYDFGAVDIVADKYNKMYVLEVNSAPGLTIENRLNAYVTYFKEQEKLCQNV